MLTLPRRSRGSTDRGMTLVEVLVTLVLISFVGTIIVSVIIAALNITRGTTAGAGGQSELNDAVSRITRDIAAADPILATGTDTTPAWSKNTPAADEVWVQSVQGGHCVRTRYWVDYSGSRLTLKGTTEHYPGASCPDPRLPAGTNSGADVVTKTLVGDLKTTDNDGNSLMSGGVLKVFTYYTKDNTPITGSAVARATVPQIARVKVDVGANVRDRANGVRLATSVAPRSMDNPTVTNAPPPDCDSINFVASWDDLAPRGAGGASRG